MAKTHEPDEVQQVKSTASELGIFFVNPKHVQHLDVGHSKNKQITFGNRI